MLFAVLLGFLKSRRSEIQNLKSPGRFLVLTSKAAKNRNEALDKVAEAEWHESMEARERLRVSGAAQRLGAIKALGTLGRNLSARAFRAYQSFIEDSEGEGWRTLGYTTVVEFLNSPDSYLTKNQYYDRLNAINREGDTTFDLLNSLQISLSGRKLLGDGEIRVEETEVHIGDNRIPISDRAQVKSLIATLVESRATAQDTIEKQQKTIDKGRKDVDKWKRKADEAARSTSATTSSSPHFEALLTLQGAYVRLRNAVADLKPVEDESEEALDAETTAQREQEIAAFKRTVVEAIGASYLDLMGAFDELRPGAPSLAEIAEEAFGALHILEEEELAG